MPRGGRRPGAGRPSGERSHPPSRELTVVQQQVQEEMQQRRETAQAAVGVGRLKAIDVIEENMMWGRETADAMLQKCQEHAEQGAVNAAVDWFDQSLKLRLFTQKAAEALAPYQDPRLAATVPAEPPGAGDDARDVTPQVVGKDRLKHITARYGGSLTVVEGGAAKKKG